MADRITRLETRLEEIVQKKELDQMHLDVLKKQLATLDASLTWYKTRVETLEHLLFRYHALLDTWDLDIAEHVPFSIAEAAEQEKMSLQSEAYTLLPSDLTHSKLT